MQSLFTYPRSVLYTTDVELHGDVKAVQEVSSKDHRVHRGVNGMDPTCSTQVIIIPPECFCRLWVHVSVYLRVWWRCSPASVQSSDSQMLGLPRTHLLVSLTVPSSHRAPGSEESEESAKTPENKSAIHCALLWDGTKQTLFQVAPPLLACSLYLTGLMRWPEAVTGKRSSPYVSWPLVASPCSLSVCGTILKSHQSRCGSLCSSPQHSSDSICGDTSSSSRLTSYRHTYIQQDTYFCTLGYCMSLIELVESLCLSFRCRGHMLSTQSIRSTYTCKRKTKYKQWEKKTKQTNRLNSL